MLFVSLLNRMLTSLNKNELKYYIGIIAFISTVLPLFVSKRQKLKYIEKAV